MSIQTPLLSSTEAMERQDPIAELPDHGADPEGSGPKRRTKTGCLTCRRRRIKCGEEKPICGNCVKSKRPCEGYSQRVVFKEPVSTWRTATSARKSQQPSASARSVVVTSAPPARSHFPPGTAAVAAAADVFSKTTGASRSAPTNGIQKPAPAPQNLHGSFSQFSLDPSPKDQTVGTDTIFSPATSQQSHLANPPTVFVPYTTNQNWPLQGIEQNPSAAESMLPSQNVLYGNHLGRQSSSAQDESERESSFRGLPGQLDVSQNPLVDDAKNHYDIDDQIGTDQQSLFQNASFDDENDDLYDVSDEEMDHGNFGYQHEASLDILSSVDNTNNVLSVQMRQNQQNQQLRTYHSLVNDFRHDMLTTYLPSLNNSPLRDPTIARIFHHFINVLGPTISSYERHPANPSLMFQGFPIPPSQQHIWTYVMPTHALHDLGLLHAMLALSSYHIAKLQDVPVTASLKHYHIALRRIAKNVGLPQRRERPATLAAVMLLGFYELMSAEQQKWSNHLLGATQLIKQIDLKGKTKAFNAAKRSNEMTSALDRRRGSYMNDPYDSFPGEPISEASDDGVDENLLSILAGKSVSFGTNDRVVCEEDSSTGDRQQYTKQDFAVYELQLDLFWWYCKQDVYQCVLSGNRLFMNYNNWTSCPPRAPIGQLHALYGTYDHVMLLFGRVADFAAKDLKRKRRVMAANGGHWRPPTGFQMPQPPAGANSAPRPNPGPPPQPMFPGMIPNIEGKASLPRGFSPQHEPEGSSPESTIESDSDLDHRTKEAEEEWQDIRGAFEVLKSRLGPDFQALGADHARQIDSPFGPALQYRTYGIAGIWMNFYTALIVCHRAHPTMPPAAMMAAGIAAKQTDGYAYEIGRITAGIAEDIASFNEVSTQIGASLIESSIALLVAAVQYQSPVQRAWTVQTLFDVSRLTGWQTGISVANGIETAWIKAAEMGRGPPYTRVLNYQYMRTPMYRKEGRRTDDSQGEQGDEVERQVVSKQERVHYVLGILGVEEDFHRLELVDQ